MRVTGTEAGWWDAALAASLTWFYCGGLNDPYFSSCSTRAAFSRTQLPHFQSQTDASAASGVAFMFAFTRYVTST
jgi:hypothetical protein